LNPRRLKVLAVTLWLVATSGALAQGGPPMITDDPGTPGNGHWENNVAIAFEHRPNETSLHLPSLDLNYGLGDHIQLTLQTSGVIQKRSGQGAIGGLGETEAALKWRFLDEETSGVSISTFPRIIFNVLQSSVRRGLAEDGTRVQLPVQVARKLGRFNLGFEFGALASTVGRSEWLYGIVGATAVSSTTTLMAELHGTSRTNFTRDVLIVNLGVRQTLSKSCNLLASLGHEVRAPVGESLALIGYCGLQLLY
jgi:hypothetical protein